MMVCFLLTEASNTLNICLGEDAKLCYWNHFYLKASVASRNECSAITVVLSDQTGKHQLRDWLGSSQNTSGALCSVIYMLAWMTPHLNCG